MAAAIAPTSERVGKFCKVVKCSLSEDEGPEFERELSLVSYRDLSGASVPVVRSRSSTTLQPWDSSCFPSCIYFSLSQSELTTNLLLCSVSEKERSQTHSRCEQGHRREFSCTVLDALASISFAFAGFEKSYCAF